MNCLPRSNYLIAALDWTQVSLVKKSEFKPKLITQSKSLPQFSDWSNILSLLDRPYFYFGKMTTGQNHQCLLNIFNYFKLNVLQYWRQKTDAKLQWLGH